MEFGLCVCVLGFDSGCVGVIVCDLFWLCFAGIVCN